MSYREPIAINDGASTILPRVAHLVGVPSHELPSARLCEMMQRLGSNKADRVNHAYTPFYEALFEDLNPRYVFEIGIGSNHPGVPYGMKPHNIPGGSLRGWREFFPAASVYGADYDTRVLFTEDRLNASFHVNQYDAASISKMWERVDIQTGRSMFDLIVDDAVHEFEPNRLFFEGSLHRLRIGGWYVIEDLNTDQSRPGNFARFAEWLRSMPHDALIIQVPSRTNFINNAFAVVQKRQSVTPTP